jgi:G3E family GTPase
MQLHLVGGFLGSGKTTAIISISRQLISHGKKVGVVTNDQGKYLVDTSFLRSQQIPTVEVTNGCFCCRYEDLEEKLEQLTEKEKPDVVFAESVGSCSDIVATVIKPLLELAGSKTPPTSFSVFADGRLLLAFLEDEELPFSENVLYIFKKQIEEAQILVINKADLLSAAEAERLLNLSAQAFPDKIIRLQNSTSDEDTRKWYDLISSNSTISTINTVEMDYEKYGKGEAELAWFDQEVEIRHKTGNVFPLIVDLIQLIFNKIVSQRDTIGHLKLMITSGKEQIKISIPTIEQEGWQEDLLQHQGNEAKILINARVQSSPTELSEIIRMAIHEISKIPGVLISTSPADSFQPGFPNPTHRFNQP